MDLKDFIKETITQIGEAVVEVQKHFNDNKVNAIVNPREIEKSDNPNYPAQYNPTHLVGFMIEDAREEAKQNAPRVADNIEFDVAVTVEQEGSKNTGGKLKIFSLEIGGESNQVDKLSNVSTVKFKIPFVMPHGRENE